jgi:PAS domain S-box-containing protein
MMPSAQSGRVDDTAVSGALAHLRMTDLTSPLAFLTEPRLTLHATSAAPAWLWSADATRILWANPTGSAIFAAATPAQCTQRRFGKGEPAALQIARLAATLSPAGTPRFERLRGFTTGMIPLLCTCSRILLVAHESAILVIAVENAGPALSLAERVRRILDGVDEALAVFAADGPLIHATQRGRERLGGIATLAGFADGLACDALRGGQASGLTTLGKISITRMGSGAATTLAVSFAAERLVTSALSLRLESQSPERPAEQPIVTPDAHLPALPQIEMSTRARRHPLRFVWQMDASGRFTLGSDEFSTLIGPQTALAFGRAWSELADELGLDPTGEVERAIATRDTWSGITVLWPVDGSPERLTVELSGLPVYDGSRRFLGYRGFGVCRQLDRIAVLMQARRQASAMPVGAAGVAPASAPMEVLRRMDEPVPAANVVPFRVHASASDGKTPALSAIERTAFRELARELTARLQAPPEGHLPEVLVREDSGEVAATTVQSFAAIEMAPDAAQSAVAKLPQLQQAHETVLHEVASHTPPPDERPLLDHLPFGILVYGLDSLLYANRAFLEWTGHTRLAEFEQAGGLDSLLIESAGLVEAAGNISRALKLSTHGEASHALDGRLVSIPWQGEGGRALVLIPTSAPVQERTAADTALARAQAEKDELVAILDHAGDGVVVIASEGRIVSANRSAGNLFGYEPGDLAGRSFADLFATESQRVAREQVKALLRDGVTPLRNYAREVVGRARHGGLLPLHMTMAAIAPGAQKVCAVFRDITQWKRTEAELVVARRQAEKDSLAKSEFLAKVSHDLRTPLNSIIGFSEVMIDGRFGAIGNERYLDYLKDIHASGRHVVSLLNDLVDLSKIEAGKLDLTLVRVNLNVAVQHSVALMQAQANRERVIIRSALSPTLPQIVADARSARQIVINLISNSIKFTGAGGQVIISTALSDAGEVVLRVRNSGAGMNEKDIAVALEPFRQVMTSRRWDANATGLGLPLTKALTEANGARFALTSKVDEGTLIEVTFPPSRVLKE